MDKQINNNHKILGIIFLCVFGIQALTFIFVLLMVGISIIPILSEINKGQNDIIFGSIGIYVGIIIFLLIYLLPFGIGGWKLFKNKSGAKIWGVIASIFSVLFFFPLGFVLCILGFVLLFIDQTNKTQKHLYSNQVNDFNMPQYPHKWQ